MEKRKLISIIGAIALCAVVFSSCAEKELSGMSYSNLADAKSELVVSDALKQADVPENNIERLMQNAKQFNQAVKNTGLVETGFADMSEKIPEYNQEKLQELWNDKYPDFPGVNCRITAFALLKDSITVKADKEENGRQMLFLDAEALDTAPEKILDRKEKEQFFTLFSAVPTVMTKDRDVHLKKIKNAWQKRGVEFRNGKASLITVWFHDAVDEDENELFVGHAGVLVPTSDGKLLFIEKLAFQEPFQVNVFENRTQLSEYLMKKYDVEWEQPTASPFIMENGELMKEK